MNNNPEKIRCGQVKDCTVSVPGSKSFSHRMAIAAGLADGNSSIYNMLDSEDLSLTLRALSQLGVKIEKNNNNIRIEGVAGRPEPAREKIFLGNSGTSTDPVDPNNPEVRPTNTRSSILSTPPVPSPRPPTFVRDAERAPERPCRIFGGTLGAPRWPCTGPFWAFGVSAPNILGACVDVVGFCKVPAPGNSNQFVYNACIIRVLVD